jgi:hypothetical protein
MKAYKYCHPHGRSYVMGSKQAARDPLHVKERKLYRQIVLPVLAD